MNTRVDSRMIELVHVNRSFKRADGQTVKAVQDVSVVVEEGEFVCLVGPSGCGKSTLLQMVAGLLEPSDGGIAVAGKEISGPGRERGMVFQKDSVFPWMRVIDNVEYGLKCRGVAAAQRRDIARTYLARVGLAHVERAWPRELSGGMLKRVAIATVFANGGRVLLLDEPFGALDYVTRRQLQSVLLNLWDEGGSAARRTILFVTHDVDEALALADRILVFHSGRQVDDLAVTAERPRTVDSLLLPDMVAIKRKLLAHLGLEEGSAASRIAASHEAGV
ncbi:ABC transporter ATP-binding protein [Methylocapsa sp. S129]|uniref:ABC transporter ATP-binding protein n=1 Tax=Methylocapsa sp. S129 TaxID=1641869 RepID=UPI00131C5A2D|nr:ABC transporter ATP-binding protein [Methylocapsa sp. S129]